MTARLSKLRVAGLGALALSLPVALWAVDRTFARADARKAVERVRRFQAAAGGPTVEAWLRGPGGGPAECGATVTDAVRGHVRVECRAPFDPEAIAFRVDLVSGRVEVADERTRERLARDAPAPPTR